MIKGKTKCIIDKNFFFVLFKFSSRLTLLVINN